MPNGIIRGVEDALAQTLAACHAWQHWQGANLNSTQALARIYRNALPKPVSGGASHTLAELQALRPFILIYTDTDGGFVMDREAASSGYDQSGKVIACIEQDVPEALLDDPAGVDDAIQADLELLLRSEDPNEPGLAELADLPGKFIPRRIVVIGPVRTAEEDLAEMGDAQRVWLEITWGFK